MKTCQYYKCGKTISDKVIFEQEDGDGPTITTYLCKEHAKHILRNFGIKK